MIRVPTGKTPWPRPWWGTGMIFNTCSISWRFNRLLKARLEGYDYERDVGGAVYLFLRGVNKSGQGVYVDKPPARLINELDNLFKADNVLEKGDAL